MSATIAYLRNRNYTGLNDIDAIKEEFYKAHIIVSYDAQVTDGKRRVIFTATKGMRSQKFDKITYECNGLILEAPTWNPLVVPCPMPKSSVNNETFSRLLNRGNYKMYKITDGTIIYLYYWNDAWRISTARGLDMANVELNGITYMTLFNEVLTKYGTTWDEFYTSLTTDMAYSFVFRHSKLHPFMAPNNESIIFIHKTYVTDGKIIFDRADHGLPYIFDVQEEITELPKLRQIYSNLATSMDMWLKNKKNPLFGYLFISTAPYRIGGDHSCILLESCLMRNIRQSVYDRKFMEFGPNRQLGATVYAYLSQNKDLYLKLFPQADTIYKQLESVQSTLVNGILKKLQDGQVEHETKTIEEVDADAIDYLTKLVTKKITIDTADNKAAIKHVHGIINSNKYTGVYMNCITQPLSAEEH